MPAHPAEDRADGQPSAPLDQGQARRLHQMAIENFQFIWRSLRRLGVPADSVDDAAQQVFVVAVRKIGAIEEGRERAFLYMTAVRVASDARRAATLRREVPSPEAIELRADAGLGQDELLDRGQERALLDHVLDAMPADLRMVFTLFELEGMPSAEIAALLTIPVGTVASRLRRAREDFHATARRLRARQGGGRP